MAVGLILVVGEIALYKRGVDRDTGDARIASVGEAIARLEVKRRDS
jgi:hypothetical protein